MPLDTTLAVPTTAAVRTTGAPTTPTRAARAGRRGMSGSLGLGCGGLFLGLERSDDRLDRDASARDELTTSPTGSRREGRGPSVLPHEHSRDRAGLHRVGDVRDVIGRQ